MNFRNSEISTLRCLEGRKSYRKVKYVSKSDKNWICYSDLKKKSLFLKQSLAELKMQFSKMVNFRPRKSCVVSKCFSLTSRKVSWNPNCYRFENNRANARKLNVYLKSFDNFFHATKFVSQQTLSGNVVELCEGYPRMKTISKSVHIWLLLWAKNRRKSHKNGRFGIKTTFFEV